MPRWVGIVEHSICRKRREEQWIHYLNLHQKNFMMLRLGRVDEVIQRAKEKMYTIQTRLNVLEKKKVLTKMKRRKRLR